MSRLKNYKENFEKEDYSLFEIRFDSKSKTKILIGICSNGHDYKTNSKSWNAGFRCKICSLELNNSKKYEEYSSKLTKEGYQLLFIQNTSLGSRLITLCPKGHSYESFANNWNQGYRCKLCKFPKWTIEMVEDLFKKEGYQLLTEKFTKKSDLYSFLCPNNHFHKMTLNAWLSGTRCGVCHSKPLDYYQMVREVELNNLILLNDPKINTEALLLKCKVCDHQWNTNYFRWRRCKFQTCPNCRRQVRLSTSQVKQILQKENYILVSDYTSADQHIEAICPNGHNYTFTLTNFQQGYRCGECSSKVTAPHRELIDRYEDLSPSINTKKVIYPKELDLYFKDRNLAIEYCGIYWHSDKRSHIHPTYHRDKMIACRSRQIRLITIFEDEWISRKAVCISHLDRLLDCNIEKISSKKCLVRSVSKDCIYEFILTNNIVFRSDFNFGYGLYYQEKLVQVVAGEALEGLTLKLTSLTTASGYVVDGGAEKLFKSFKRFANKNLYEKIEVLIDMRWETGDVYRHLGFDLFQEIDYKSHCFKGLKKRSNEEVKANTLIVHDCGYEIWNYTCKKNLKKREANDAKAF